MEKKKTNKKLTNLMWANYLSPAMVTFVVSVNELALYYYFHLTSYHHYCLMNDVTFLLCYVVWHYFVDLVLMRNVRQVLIIKRE